MKIAIAVLLIAGAVVMVLDRVTPPMNVAMAQAVEDRRVRELEEAVTLLIQGLGEHNKALEAVAERLEMLERRLERLEKLEKERRRADTKENAGQWTIGTGRPRITVH